MFQATQVKHAHAAILPAAHEHIHTLRAEAHVVDLLVVSDKLRLCGQGRDIPDRAGCVYTGSDDEAGRDGIPIQRRQWGCVVRCLGVGQKGQWC